ncbi:Erythronate-4-phosphate dehydrogenase [termite gut metagenome]|uniref:Erythronate-4-phosphate dehydrogenase n=1 Tax=termite gut metagenome TaxID=433724 RepID=A0A5J4QTS2_9ZZZZ
MKIIVDDKIPYIKEAIRQIANDVIFVSGKDFTPKLICDADALIVRTRTHCNRKLLEGSHIRLIVTATAGCDHIDTEYCRQTGIVWNHAAGCNSSSVAQYVQSSLLVLQQTSKIALEKLTIGIVGVGNVGTKVAEKTRKAGMRVLINDLPRQEKEGMSQFTNLTTIARECDVITFHTPLYREGKYKTYHLANEMFFRSLRRRPVIINTSRGEVVDTGALLNAFDTGIVSNAVIDVWEGEPIINRTLLEKAVITTPHIAGYSADGKANATCMSLQAICKHFGITASFEVTPPPPDNTIIHAKTYEEALLKIYNPQVDSDALKANPEQFEKLREEYPLRREEQAYHIIIDAYHE